MNNLLSRLNHSPFDFYFLAVDEFLNISLPELTNFYSISPTSLGIKLTEKNSGRLLSHPVTQSFIESNSRRTGRRPAIIPFKPSARLEVICRQKNWLLVANPASTNRHLEDKIKFHQTMLDLKLPVLPAIIGKFTPDVFTRALKELGGELVVQTHFGWAGNSSYLAKSYQQISSTISPEETVKITAYLPGYSLINNCCLTGHGLIQSPPGLQYTGLSPLTKNPLATVGRQWPSFAPIPILDKIKIITTDFSDYLAKINYRGFFGLDFLVNSDQVYLLECNPRLTASFAFYTAMEAKIGLTPLYYYHLAEFTKLLHNSDLAGNDDRFNNLHLVGSEITAKNIRGATVKKYQDFTAFTKMPHPVNIPQEIIAKVL